MMKPRPIVFLLLAALCLLASAACRRAPSNAYEAKELLPRAFAGKVSEGDERGGGGARTVRVPTDALRVRDEHTLEFESVHFLLLNPLDDSILVDETLPARGAITIPGGEIKLEDAGHNPSVEAVNFVGKLADDCQSVEAGWRRDGRQETLRLKAVK